MTAFWPVGIPLGRAGTPTTRIWLTRCSGRGRRLCWRSVGEGRVHHPHGRDHAADGKREDRNRGRSATLQLGALGEPGAVSGFAVDVRLSDDVHNVPGQHCGPWAVEPRAAATARFGQCVLCGRPEGIRPNVIHIDAGHDHDAALGDLRRWWPILRPGGVMIMDGYDPEGMKWSTALSAMYALVAMTAHWDLG